MTVIDPKWLVQVAPLYYKVADPNNLSTRKLEEKFSSLGFGKNDPRAQEWRMNRRVRELDPFFN